MIIAPSYAQNSYFNFCPPLVSVCDDSKKEYSHIIIITEVNGSDEDLVDKND